MCAFTRVSKSSSSVQVYILEVIQCIISSYKTTQLSNVPVILINSTDYGSLIYEGRAEELVYSIKQAIKDLVAMTSLSKITVNVKFEGESIVALFEGTAKKNVKTIPVILPENIRLNDSLSCYEHKEGSLSIDTNDCVLVEEMTAHIANSEGKISLHNNNDNATDFILLDRRVAGSESKIEASNGILLKSIPQIVHDPDDTSLVWPFFNTDFCIKLANLANQPANKLKILVSDDSKASLFATKVMLQQLGCEVITAVDGIEALSIAEKEKFDLIFLDERMPGFFGSEVANKLSVVDSENLMTPKISLTGLTGKDDIKKLYENGITHYLEKPVTKLELEKFIAEWQKR